MPISFSVREIFLLVVQIVAAVVLVPGGVPGRQKMQGSWAKIPLDGSRRQVKVLGRRSLSAREVCYCRKRETAAAVELVLTRMSRSAQLGRVSRALRRRSISELKGQVIGRKIMDLWGTTLTVSIIILLALPGKFGSRKSDNLCFRS